MIHVWNSGPARAQRFPLGQSYRRSNGDPGVLNDLRVRARQAAPRSSAAQIFLRQRPQGVAFLHGNGLWRQHFVRPTCFRNHHPAAQLKQFRGTACIRIHVSQLRPACAIPEIELRQFPPTLARLHFDLSHAWSVRRRLNASHERAQRSGWPRWYGLRREAKGGRSKHGVDRPRLKRRNSSARVANTRRRLGRQVWNRRLARSVPL